MRPATLALGLLALAGGAVGWVAWRNGTEESQAWRRVLDLDGKDLYDKDFEAEAAALFSRFGNQVAGTGLQAFFESSPWRVFRFRPDTPEERVVLLRKRPLYEIPGSEDFIANVLSGAGRRLSSVEFSGGWRMETDDARLHARPGDPDVYVELRSKPAINGANVPRQYFGLDRDRLVVVRLQSPDGSLRRNRYDAPNHTIGPAQEHRTPEARLDDLRSDRTPRVLAQLTWLGGVHFLPSEPVDRTVRYQSDVEIRDVAAVRAHPGIRTRVLELRKSADPWIREAAEGVPLDGSR
jgi:hypothetical protein